MLGAQNKTDICLSRAPPDEWPSGISQQDLAQRLEEKVRESHGNLGRGGSPNPMGLSRHASIHHQRNTIQFGVWNECNYDRDKKEEDFTNGGRGHPTKHLKFFLLVFSKLKKKLNKERIKPKRRLQAFKNGL